MILVILGRMAMDSALRYVGVKFNNTYQHVRRVGVLFSCSDTHYCGCLYYNVLIMGLVDFMIIEITN